MKDPSLASAGGTLEVKTGYLDPYPILKELGAWTQIDELKRLDLEEALSKFSIVGQDIKVDSLELISKNCQVNHGAPFSPRKNLILTDVSRSTNS